MQMFIFPWIKIDWESLASIQKKLRKEDFAWAGILYWILIKEKMSWTGHWKHVKFELSRVANESQK